ncbi:MAG: hypothetical protein ACD_54C00956G0001, partial [uncultured bacterium]
MFGCGQHKAAADGVVGFLQDHVTLCIGGFQDHAIGVAGQRRAVIKRQIMRGVEMQRRQALGVDGLAVADRGQCGLGLGGVIG